MSASANLPLAHDPPSSTWARVDAATHPLAATRHLSAAAYVDEEFCRTAMVDVYHQRRRLIAPSYGFDLPTVLHHCGQARTGYIWRDAWLTGTIAVGVLSIVGIPSLVMLTVLLLYLRQARESGRRIRDAARAVRSATNGVLGSLRRMLESVTVTVLGLLPLGVCGALLFSRVTVSLLETLQVDTRSAEQMLVSVRVATIVVVVSVLGAMAGSSLWRQRRLDSLASYDSIAPRHLNRRLAEIAAQQDSRVTVYSGSRPFIGSGRKLADWGTSIRMVKASDSSTTGSRQAADNDADTAWPAGREFKEQPFDAADLVEHVRRRLRELIQTRADECFTADSRVFHAASRMTDLDLRPSEPTVQEVMRRPTKRVRHYLACQVISRDGELVTQVYLAFEVRPASLHTELTAYALVPCRDEYRVVDELGGTGPAADRRAIWRGLLDTPEVTGRAPLRLIGALLDWLPTLPDRLVRRRRVYDRGVAPSLREGAAASVDEVAFCHSDIRRQLRTIERQAIAVVYEFLESRGVDVTDYRQRTITILNEGILNTGVLTSEGAIVAGKNPQVTTPPAGDTS